MPVRETLRPRTSSRDLPVAQRRRSGQSGGVRARRAWVAGVAAAVLLSAAGCSTRDIVEAPAVHLVQVAQRSMGDLAKVHVARVDRVSTSSTEWQAVGVDPASRTIAMTWTDGFSPACGQVDRIEVAERADTVTIGLSDTADDPDRICAAIGNLHRFDLQLRHPLAGRALVEPVTGVNDGLPHFRSGMPPVPTCSTDANPADVPVGMPDATTRLAPRSATHASICRTTWPHGSARTSAAQVSDPSAVRRLVRVLNDATHVRPARDDQSGCGARSPGAWYAVYLTGPHTQVEVFVDEINCATVTNGVLLGRATPAIEQTLANHFRS